MANTAFLISVSTVFTSLYFISKIFEGVWNFKIKNKIIEKNTNEELARELLFHEPKKPLAEAFKYFCIIFFVGLGIFIGANFELEPNRQIGMATMTASLGFMVYFIYLKFTRV